MNTKPIKAYNEDRARADIKSTSAGIGVMPEHLDPLAEYVLKLNRDAWFKGKEFGWKKAWAWKHREEVKGGVIA